MSEPDRLTWVSAAEFLETVFEGALSDTFEFDPDVVELVKEHVGKEVLHSRAGYNLAVAIRDLALRRVADYRR
jgi:hypothetical protein